VASSDNQDGTVRVSTGDRRDARRRFDEALAEGRTVSDRAATPSEVDLVAGTPVGEYEIEGAIGRGGFGTVYRAVQPLIGKRVAIKVLSRKYSADNEIVSRFVAEARAVNQIRHRHIIDIFSFGQLADGRHYYVMEHLDGEPLDRYLAKHGPMKLDEALHILRAIARALDAAHVKGIAHRDLKPENIFLARDDEGERFPKLLDFGIAKLSAPEEALAHKTGTGVPIGTPYYMSPEQCRGRDVDHRTDIYSLGVMTFRLLTGTYPFDGELIEIMHKQIHEPPPAASSRNAALSHECDQAVAWMLQKDPDHRPRTAIAAVVALQDGKSPTPMLPVSQRRAAAVGVPVTRSSRPRWFVPVIVAALISGAIATVLLRRHREPVAGPPAPRDAVAAPAPRLAPPPAADAPAASPYVIVTVDGTPPSPEVTIAGTFVGNAPGPVQLRRGTDPVVLVFRTAGYLPVSRPVTPDREQALVVPMRKRPRATPAPAASVDERDSLAAPFKEDTR
jgi:eukaryotic-like serine/threonine-protein kinase